VSARASVAVASVDMTIEDPQRPCNVCGQKGRVHVGHFPAPEERFGARRGPTDPGVAAWRVQAGFDLLRSVQDEAGEAGPRADVITDEANPGPTAPESPPHDARNAARTAATQVTLGAACGVGGPVDALETLVRVAKKTLCANGKAWLLGLGDVSPQEAWEQCPRPNWLLWAADQADVDLEHRLRAIRALGAFVGPAFGYNHFQHELTDDEALVAASIVRREIPWSVVAAALAASAVSTAPAG
jgi:hypothetical protein